METELHSQCCIAGGGPAGIMLGYLLARAGIETLVLEKHRDFFRDFRGDTIHPSTLQVMDELGLLDEFLKLPHQELDQLSARYKSRTMQLVDFSKLNTRCKFIALMPQWDFLNFLAERGSHFKTFTLRTEVEATDLIWKGDAVVGVRATSKEGPLRIQASLTVAADGRSSVLRAKAQMPLRQIGAPIDVLWFRVGREAGTTGAASLGHMSDQQVVITINRGEYWQCAYVIGKGTAEKVKEAGLQAFQRRVSEAAPVLEKHIADVKSWDDVKLLSVAVDRLDVWNKTGFLCIGDAAHAMSPVGGVGINLALQDAVATANLLHAPLRGGTVSNEDLAGVQRRRSFPTRVTQAAQVAVQNRFLNQVISGQRKENSAPLIMRLLDAVPALRGLPARALGLGARPEHISASLRAAFQNGSRAESA